MKIALYSFTKQGYTLATQITSLLANDKTTIVSYTKERFAQKKDNIFIHFFDCITETFSIFDAHIIIGATGIAVRGIAPHIQDKTTDPAVIVCDQRGKFSISLLSGHLGGANALAIKIAKAIDAIPVITTATDIENCVACDILLQQHACTVSTPKAYTAVHASILEGNSIGVYDPMSYLMPHLSKYSTQFHEIPYITEGIPSISIDTSIPHNITSTTTIYAHPRCLYVGIGCKKYVSFSALQTAIEMVFTEHNFSTNAIAGFASSHMKSEEEGLHSLAKYYNTSIQYYTTEAMETCVVPTPSMHATRLHSAKTPISVAESTALLYAGTTTLLVSKIIINNEITIAIARGQPQKT